MLLARHGVTSWKRTIRVRLAIGFVAIVALANAIVAIVTVLHVSRVLLEEVQTRVRLNLNAAREVYDNHGQRIAWFLRALALDRSMAEALSRPDGARLVHWLQAIQGESATDILCVLDAEGKVIFRARNPALQGDDLSSNPVVARALRERQPVAGSVVIPRQVLLREGRDLAARASFEVRDTPLAEPPKTRAQHDGLALAAAVPVIGPTGQLLGLLYGANLLNRRYEIVDRIKDEVFDRQIVEDRELGTATIFQGDLRVSTNVKNEDGSRALGTRLSSAVAEQVLGRGRIWADRAFVVNDWYITAYSPIRDPTGRIIGALYVGLLEAPFVRPQKSIVRTFLMLMALTTFGSLVLLFLVTKLILRPIGSVVEMSRRVIAGDLTARVPFHPQGEMGLLSLAVNQMADAVAEREEQLKLATRKQIGQSEKLASIGRLAAGIAHEINNPLTGVLTFAHLLRKRPNLEPQDREDLDVVLRETTRVREIVRGLLDFARESPSVKQPLQVNDVIRQTMTLVRSQKEFRKVQIVEELGEGLPELQGDKNQLQQVLLNFSLNACEAMPEGGTLTIRTSARDGQVVIGVEDTGCGIKPEDLGRIFDPFFTTKPVGKGTGLGLSVSYGIIQQHGGAIDVESEAGRGTRFTVTLPVNGGAAAAPQGAPGAGSVAEARPGADGAKA